MALRQYSKGNTIIPAYEGKLHLIMFFDRSGRRGSVFGH